VPWFPMDTDYLGDPKVQIAGELTPFALSALPALLARAKTRADGGIVEVTYRDLAHALFVSPDEAEKAIKALVTSGVLTMQSHDDRSAVVKFPAWKRWNETFRKSLQREGKKA
jgi:hypothetical protein